MSKPTFTGAGEAAMKKFLGQNNDETPTVSNKDSSVSQQLADTVKPEVKPKKYVDKYRMTLILEDESKTFLDVITRLDGISQTQYINNLILADIEKRAEEFAMAVKFFKIKL